METILQGISKRSDAIINLDINEITRESSLGELNFAERKTQINTLKLALIKTRKFPLESLPQELQNKLHSKLKQIQYYFQRMKDFDLKNLRTPKQERDGILSSFDGEYNEIFPILAQIISFYEAIHEVDRENESQLDSIAELQKQVSQKAEEFFKVVDDQKTSIASTSQEFGISKYANLFSEESENFKRLSEGWFKGIVSLLILTIVVAVLFLFVFNETKDTHAILQFTISKVVILSAFFYGISICIKNYKAHKHNQILNRHRYNALTTFEIFTKSTDDQQTKNAVLLEATHAIFGNQHTGYSDVDTSDGDFSNKIIEIIKAPKQG